MDFVPLLSAIAVLPVAGKVLWGLLSTVKKAHDERIFTERLVHALRDSALMRTEVHQIAQDPSLLHEDSSALTDAQALIMDILKDMNQETRRAILEGLKQSSEQGRLNYILKLLQEGDEKSKTVG